MTKKQIKELIEIYNEISTAFNYTTENSPLAFAVAVPLASMVNFLQDECGVSDKQLGISRPDRNKSDAK